MSWIYKTVHYDLKKDGLLGGAFIDEVEMEESLNGFGKAGWELISMLEDRDGIIAVFKQPLTKEYVEHHVQETEQQEEVKEQVLVDEPDQVVQEHEDIHHPKSDEQPDDETSESKERVGEIRIE